MIYGLVNLGWGRRPLSPDVSLGARTVLGIRRVSPRIGDAEDAGCLSEATSFALDAAFLTVRRKRDRRAILVGGFGVGWRWINWVRVGLRDGQRCRERRRRPAAQPRRPRASGPHGCAPRNSRGSRAWRRARSRTGWASSGNNRLPKRGVAGRGCPGRGASCRLLVGQGIPLNTRCSPYSIFPTCTGRRPSQYRMRRSLRRCRLTGIGFRWKRRRSGSPTRWW